MLGSFHWVKTYKRGGIAPVAEQISKASHLQPWHMSHSEERGLPNHALGANIPSTEFYTCLPPKKMQALTDVLPNILFHYHNTFLFILWETT